MKFKNLSVKRLFGRVALGLVKVINGEIVEHGGAVNTFETLLEHDLIRSV